MGESRTGQVLIDHIHLLADISKCFVARLSIIESDDRYNIEITLGESYAKMMTNPETRGLVEIAWAWHVARLVADVRYVHSINTDKRYSDLPINLQPKLQGLSLTSVLFEVLHECGMSGQCFPTDEKGCFTVQLRPQYGTSPIIFFITTQPGLF